MMNISIELTAVIGAAIIFTAWISGVGFSVVQGKQNFEEYKEEKKQEFESYKKEIKEEMDKMKLSQEGFTREVRDELKSMLGTLNRIEGKLDK